MPVQPTLNAFLLCDQVLRDQRGRCSLIGIFQRLEAPKFPLAPRDFSVFISVSEVLAPGRLDLSFRDGSDARQLQHVSVDCSQATPPGLPYEINADFANVVFEGPGVYDFELRVNGSLLALRTLTLAIHADPSGEF